jgi:hypothetical protein
MAPLPPPLVTIDTHIDAYGKWMRYIRIWPNSIIYIINITPSCVWSNM